MAVAWTDVAQGILMVFTCVVPAQSLTMLGGWELLLRVSTRCDHLSLSHGSTWHCRVRLASSVASVGAWATGQPHLLMRFVATAEVRTSTLIAMWWAVPAFWGAFLIGIIGLALYGGSALETERLMPMMAQALMRLARRHHPAPSRP